MYYTREQHKRFLDKELTAISEEYLKKLNTKAIALLESHEVYVTQFVGLDLKKGTEAMDSTQNVLGSGQMMLRFKRSNGIPRKNEYFTAVILDGDICLPKNWGDLSWGKLRRHQVEFSEVHCVWQGKTDDNGFLLCGFAGLSINMAELLMKNNYKGCVIVLGPQCPPMDYYQNLIRLVSTQNQESPCNDILDFDKKHLQWNPCLINSNKENTDVILSDLEKHNEMIFQGPPGTGKTYLVANLVSRLLEQGKCVLITAMTNRALIELAQKDSLRIHLTLGNIMKTNVTADEIIGCKGLIPINGKEITCIPGKATLSTFYNTSGWAAMCADHTPFDYVIMDEASQALFDMIAACKNLGKKTIWIGDQKQMQPIIKLSEETLIRNDYGLLANGFQTLCDNFPFKSYMLNETHRLLPAAAMLTSTFYDHPLISTTNFSYRLKEAQFPFIPKHGGCSVIFSPMPVGEKADRPSCEKTIDIVQCLLAYDKKLQIAVLSKFKAAVRMLQNCFIGKFGAQDNVLIDTVERVQGMTCDVCIFYIPNTLTLMSLSKPLFNVATSRAKQLTILICDKSLLNSNCDKEVHDYLLKAVEMETDDGKSNKNAVAYSQKESNVKVVGWMDPSNFETPKQKSVKSTTKDNYYVIDTNVFVNCPDIINKIDKKYTVVLSAKVIDELDKLKVTLDYRGKENVQKALRLINQYMDKRDIIMKFADESLLPKDFNKKSPDNMIITVALQFTNGNPILLTSDNGLQVKAKGLGISTISLKDFLKR